jgi:hypothetical protein
MTKVKTNKKQKCRKLKKTFLFLYFYFGDQKKLKPIAAKIKMRTIQKSLYIPTLQYSKSIIPRWTILTLLLTSMLRSI